MSLLQQFLEFQKLFTTEDVISVHNHNFKGKDPHILCIGTTKDNLFSLVVKGGGITALQSSEDRYGKSVSIIGLTPDEVMGNFLKVLDDTYMCIVSASHSWASSKEGFSFFIQKDGKKIVRLKVNASYENNSSFSTYD